MCAIFIRPQHEQYHLLRNDMGRYLPPGPALLSIVSGSARVRAFAEAGGGQKNARKLQTKVGVVLCMLAEV